MDCERARGLLLEADVADLLGESDSELARHLAACAACRRAAAEIVDAERGLGDWLGRATPRLDESLAVTRAAAAARRRAAGRRIGAVGGLAAAAVLAALLLLPRRGLPPSEAAGPPANRAGEGFFVTTPPGREMIVLHTANPKIVVVWYLPSRRSS